MNNTKELKTGRRKTSVAQVELLKGKGVITVNAKSLDEYFGNHARCKAAVKAPLVVTNLEKEYDVNAKVIGGGVSSQAGALRHAIARSLVKKPSRRPVILPAIPVWWKERNPVSPAPANASSFPNVNRWLETCRRCFTKPRSLERGFSLDKG